MRKKDSVLNKIDSSAEAKVDSVQKKRNKMKKALWFFAVVTIFCSCEINMSSSTGQKVDSTIKKLDSAAERIGDKAGEAWDSTKSKAKELKEGLDTTFKSKKDK